MQHCIARTDDATVGHCTITTRSTIRYLIKVWYSNYSSRY